VQAGVARREPRSTCTHWGSLFFEAQAVKKSPSVASDAVSSPEEARAALPSARFSIPTAASTAAAGEAH